MDNTKVMDNRDCTNCDDGCIWNMTDAEILAKADEIRARWRKELGWEEVDE